MVINDDIYLDLAGFIVRISFGDVRRPVLQEAKRKIKKDIIKYFSDFRIKNAKIINFQVEFVERTKEFNVILFKKNNKKLYMKLYEQRGKNKIETYYSLSIHQFQFIINNVLSNYLSKNDGFIIHSSGVSDGRKSYLFLGVSGAGKSTAARLLSSKYELLVDDTGIVKKKGEEYYFYQTPFIEKIKWIKKKSVGYPIKKIFIVKQAKFFRIDKIVDKSIILNKLIKFNEVNRKLNFNLGESGMDSKYIESLLNFIAKFDEFYYLYFAKDYKKLAAVIDEQNE